ncbi:DUF1028 domain-containing protein [Aquipuribacter sp. MA13-6]|uniref:DUF1028 domain-containing protein n=1 Tax=unclassified Aquipuribacter TaxID=2635084 RepID=UPI003EE8B7BD
MTYSIIARDPETGQMGVATQSQAFAVGSSVSWAAPGAGVVATQSMGEPMYGDLGLDALRAGLTADEALTALRSVDPHPERRQVGMVDAAGRFAVYTGEACVAAAGHLVGDCSVSLANIVRGPQVWEAMVESFEASTGWLPRRLLGALRAAEDAGGDERGQRSAAVVVVRSQRSGRPWQDQVVDLRVDDAPDAVSALSRLVEHTDVYHRTVEAFELALDGQGAAAVAALPEQVPTPAGEPDLTLWRAVVLAAAGRAEEARDLGVGLAAARPDFVEVARRFVPAGLVDAELLDVVLLDVPPPDGQPGQTPPSATVPSGEGE